MKNQRWNEGEYLVNREVDRAVDILTAVVVVGFAIMVIAQAVRAGWL